MRITARPCRIVAVLALAGLAASSCATSPPTPEIQSNTEKARIHYDMGVNQLNQGNTALAIRELLYAQSLDHKSAWIPYALAEAYRRVRHLDKAEALLHHALELDPKFQSAQLNLSAVYLEMGKYEKAIPLAKELADDPTFPRPWRALTNLGWAYYKLGNNGEARRQLELAVNYDDDYWPAQLDLGILKADEGHPLEALHCFGKVVQAKAGPFAEAEAHYRMAEVYVTLGRRDEAIEQLDTATALHPSGRWGERSANLLQKLR